MMKKIKNGEKVIGMQKVAVRATAAVT